MTTIHLCAFLETQHEVLHDILTNSPGNGSDFLPDDFFEISYGPGSPCVHSVLQAAPKEEIRGAKVRAVRCPLKISLRTDHMSSKVLSQPAFSKI